MPEICRFYGIIIRMYFNDHTPPHFHAQYGNHDAIVDIEKLSVISGALPPRALGLVMEWSALHQTELRDRWARARNLEPLDPIDPLP
jgi:hypothetical protein